MIRKYAPEDLSELLDVWYEASQIAHSFLSRDFFEQERKNIIHEYLPAAETWVFETGGRVVGFISLLGNEVGAIFVSPEQQGKGVGRALMDHARASREHLVLDVFEANEIGKGFYAAYGFDVIDRRAHEETGHLLLRLRLEG